MDVAKRVYDTMEDMSRLFPAGISYKVPYDTTIFVEESIKEVYITLFQAAALVFLVLFIFLQDWRATLVPAVAIPVSLIGTFAAMGAIGFSLNMLTLFGLVLAIGVVVDDAIVVVEATAAHMERGLNSKDAAIKAMSEVSGPVIATTLGAACGVRAGRVPAGDHRRAVPPVRAHDRRLDPVQHDERPDHEPGVVRAAAAPTEATEERLLPRL